MFQFFNWLIVVLLSSFCALTCGTSLGQRARRPPANDASAQAAFRLGIQQSAAARDSTHQKTQLNNPIPATNPGPSFSVVQSERRLLPAILREQVSSLPSPRGNFYWGAEQTHTSSTTSKLLPETLLSPIKSATVTRISSSSTKRC